MLCPEGSEGLVYAVLTTIMNLSGTVASDIGSAMTLIWDVSNETYVLYLYNTIQSHVKIIISVPITDLYSFTHFNNFFKYISQYREWGLFRCTQSSNYD